MFYTQHTLIIIYSGAKKYLVSHQLCKFSHLKRWERPVIFIIGIPQLWETKLRTKFHLNTLLYTLCWQWQRSNVFCKSSQGFHTLLLVFWPIPPCRSPLEQWCFGTFNSLQRFSMGLRSGDWLGHSRTLKCFLRSQSFVARAVCLGSLSCWKTQPRFIFNALADGRRFSLKISRYMAPFILSFTQISRPGPFAEQQPQSMMFPPPCFTVGMVFFGCNSAFFLLQTRQVEFLPKSYIWFHLTFSQSSSGSSKCSLATSDGPGHVLA